MNKAIKDTHSPIPLIFTEEVHDAIQQGLPVVALESNVISHGLKYPYNLETANLVEEAVRKGGAIPATIGIENGQFLIGMTDHMKTRFATESGIPKVSSRDLPVVLAKGGLGASTVASSLVAAELANIPFFSSAGIGGVHRGAETSMDISSDLIQFTRSKVAVVCAGAKNILDLGLTMEFLETQCVPLVSYRYDDFPAFYCRSSGLPSPHRIDDPHMIARTIETYWNLGKKGAVLITTPTKEEDAIDSNEIDAEINKAIAAAKRDGVSGNGVTKYIMHAIDEVTQGRSATANMKVLINTAEVAGQLAVAHSQLKQESAEYRPVA
ncbi:pseudouridine-5'-phosphate glycosidase [Flocculibacter collagenilyticus]|uniref:pseudouridine-5'-phosphate glycosidase n=1 Tax=Flocculibacter collagenilyticus TaxID=2744479 RepID=UPI0018F347C8|nr:pseudouridine-5'-phosphate glycosidase [Flocculibacter collagenilyticus]